MSANSSPQLTRLVIWLVVAAAVVGVLVYRANRPHPGLQVALSNPAVGHKLPELALDPLTGTSEGLSLESLRGKVALVNFWGPWCSHCVKEFPGLTELWDRNRAKPDFAFVSVSSTGDAPENVSKLQQDTERFLTQQRATLPTYSDTTGVSRDMLASLMGEQQLDYPTTIALDRDGVVRAVWRGYADGSEYQMEQVVSDLLNET